MTVRFACFAMAAAIVATSPAAQAAESLSGTWRAVRALGGDVQGPELTFNGTQISGSGGCNRFSGTAVIDKAALKFGPLRATKMFCSGRMNTETVFLSALDAVRAYAIVGSELVLRDETGSAVAIFKR